MVQMNVIPTDVSGQRTISENEIPAGVREIKAPEMWDLGFKGKNVKIAIIDTGCDRNHPDLKDRIIGGRNFTDEDRGLKFKYDDYNGHGTHVAGIIAASGNGTGVVGVAPEARLLILKTMDRNGSGSYESVIEAIKYAIKEKVDIISMSLGGGSDVKELHDIIKVAIEKNILVVCAAANSGDGNPDTSEYAYPGYYNEVISVGAMDVWRNPARFSNSHDQIDVIAPGVNILSTHLNGGYSKLSGTSMAAPHVSGALALLINWGEATFGRKLTEAELYSQLIRRAISIGKPKVLEGNGMIYLTAQDILEEMLKNKQI